METILKKYYDNEGARLHHVVDKLLSKFGGISPKDYDDFYSLANEVFARIIVDYDDEKNFETYLYSCLDRKIKTEMTRRNRTKRQADRKSVSLDLPNDDGETTLGDLVEGKFDLDKEVFGEEEIENPKIKAYLNRLSKVQRKIIEMISIDYKPEEIENELHITHKQYLDGLEAIHSYNNTKILLGA